MIGNVLTTEVSIGKSIGSMTGIGLIGNGFTIIDSNYFISHGILIFFKAEQSPSSLFILIRH